MVTSMMTYKTGPHVGGCLTISCICCVCFKPKLTSMSQVIACEIVKVAF